MTERRTETTLTGPRRCPYCGHRCHGRTCRYCTDLERAERAVWRSSTGDDLPTMRDELAAAKPKPAIPAFRPTCPNCGDVGGPRAFACSTCGTLFYLPKSDPLYRPPPGART